MTPFFWKTLASFSFRYRQSIAYISTEHSGNHWRFHQRACALVHPSLVVSDWHYCISKYQYHICLPYLPYLPLLFIHYEGWRHRTIQHRSDLRCLASSYYLCILCQRIASTQPLSSPPDMHIFQHLNTKLVGFDRGHYGVIQSRFCAVVSTR